MTSNTSIMDKATPSGTANAKAQVIWERALSPSAKGASQVSQSGRPLIRFGGTRAARDLVVRTMAVIKQMEMIDMLAINQQLLCIAGKELEASR